MKYQKVTVGGFLEHNGKVLMIRRSPKESYLTGYYELPGGKVDFGEHPTESLEREFREEVNLKIIAIRPYKIFTYVSDNGNRHTVELVYFVKLEDDISNLQIADCHDDYKWVSKEDINSVKMSEEMKQNILEGFELKNGNGGI